MRRPGILVGLILVVGIAGTVVALKSHESNAEFALQQQSLVPVAPAALQMLLLTSHDSRPGYGTPSTPIVRSPASASPSPARCCTPR
jgi:hypothetical protein